GRVVVEAVVLAPPGQRRRRRAEARCPVDRRRPADATTLEDVDRLVLGLARGRLLVQLRIRIGLAHPEVARALERAFLDHQYAQAGAREDLGGNAAPRAGAHDRHVAVDLLGQGRGGGVQYLPAACEAFCDRIG